MGLRRRPTQISAAALPASRLPIGTPTFQCSKPSPAPTISHSPPHDHSRNSFSSSERHDMAPKHAPEPDLTKSIAEAKLERQQKRIEEGGAPRKTGRSKGKQWKPFDFTADAPKNTKIHEAVGTPVSEVRVNTFRALSGDSSSARSTSLISRSTTDTAASDSGMECYDSTHMDSPFQVVKARKQKKNVEDLNVYEDKPETRQTTVEATFDKREIYEVFGNALPGPEFIVETIGHKDGLLQFIQHPNGDISAHQWSNERYIWENIGQFSNIRKRVEGQLASDRLKGQTAHQTLQQNTLAYFRTIAMQREANAMGLPFGPKEIQAAMPLQRPVELTAAPTGLKVTDKDINITKQQHGAAQTGTQSLNQSCETSNISTITKLKPPAKLFRPQNSLQGQTQHVSNYPQQPLKYEDPFYSGSTYQQIYGGLPYMQQYYTPNRGSAIPAGRFDGVTQRPQGFNYDFDFPPVGQPGRAPQVPSGQARVPESAAIESRPEPHWQQDPWNQTADAISQASLPLHGAFPYPQHNFNNPSSIPRTPATGIAAPQPEFPFGNRASMSDQLWKISETAKERNLSQSSISRTVLYDPYRDQSAVAREEPLNEPVKQSKLPVETTFSQNVVGCKLQPPTSFDPTSANFFPTVLAPRVAPSEPPQSQSSLMTKVAGNNLQESSPDTYRSRMPPSHSTPPVASATEPTPTSRYFEGQCSIISGNSHAPGTETITSDASKKTYDEELKEWWTSGNKFARQEEFFESIKAAHKPLNSTTSIVNTPPHLTPIGPPSRTPKKERPVPFNQTTTRLLIPVLENLASYVQGPIEKRRDYFSQWSQPPEWCIDRSQTGNNSFFDSDWGQPPARVGRDPRYQNRSWSVERSPQVNRFTAPGNQASAGYRMNVAVGSGIDRRFNFAGRY